MEDHLQIVIAVAAGDGVVADRLQGFDRSVFGFLTAHLEVCDLAVVCYNERVAEDSRVAEFFHQRSCELREGIADDDYLCHFSEIVEEFFCARKWINLGNCFLNLFQSKIVLFQNIETVFH